MEAIDDLEDSLWGSFEIKDVMDSQGTLSDRKAYMHVPSGELYRYVEPEIIQSLGAGLALITLPVNAMRIAFAGMKMTTLVVGDVLQMCQGVLQMLAGFCNASISSSGLEEIERGAYNIYKGFTFIPYHMGEKLIDMTFAFMLSIPLMIAFFTATIAPLHGRRFAGKIEALINRTSKYRHVVRVFNKLPDTHPAKDLSQSNWDRKIQQIRYLASILCCRDGPEGSQSFYMAFCFQPLGSRWEVTSPRLRRERPLQRLRGV